MTSDSDSYSGHKEIPDNSDDDRPSFSSEYRGSYAHDDKDEFLSLFRRWDASRFDDFDILYDLCESSSVNCAEALIAGETDLKVDVNVPFSAGTLPLHVAADTFSYEFAGMLLRHGARTDIPIQGGYKDIDGLLPLNVAVENTCLHKYLEECWTKDDSVHKLLILLCMPEMKLFRDVTRLLAQHTKQTLDILLKYVEDGKFLQMAILVLVAHEKLLHHDTNGRGSAMDLLHTCVDKTLVSLAKELKTCGHKHKNCKAFRQLKERVDTMALASSFLDVIEKIGDALDQYLQYEVTREEAIRHVTYLLFHEGIILKSEDINFGNLNGYRFRYGSDYKGKFYPEWRSVLTPSKPYIEIPDFEVDDGETFVFRYKKNDFQGKGVIEKEGKKRTKMSNGKGANDSFRNGYDIMGGTLAAYSQFPGFRRPEYGGKVVAAPRPNFQPTMRQYYSTAVSRFIKLLKHI